MDELGLDRAAEVERGEEAREGGLVEVVDEVAAVALKGIDKSDGERWRREVEKCLKPTAQRDQRRRRRSWYFRRDALLIAAA